VSLISIGILPDEMILLSGVFRSHPGGSVSSLADAELFTEVAGRSEGVEDFAGSSETAGEWEYSTRPSAVSRGLNNYRRFRTAIIFERNLAAVDIRADVTASLPRLNKDSMSLISIGIYPGETILPTCVTRIYSSGSISGLADAELLTGDGSGSDWVKNFTGSPEATSVREYSARPDTSGS